MTQEQRVKLIADILYEKAGFSYEAIAFYIERALGDASNEARAVALTGPAR